MKAKITLIILLVLSLACYAVQLGVKSYYHHKEPPPGWRIVTNGKGNYAPQHSSSGHVIARDYGAITYGMSYQRAINRAWEQYEYEMEASGVWKSWRPIQ